MAEEGSNDEPADHGAAEPDHGGVTADHGAAAPEVWHRVHPLTPILESLGVLVGIVALLYKPVRDIETLLPDAAPPQTKEASPQVA